MLRIGELAAAAGTTTRTIRHYHSLGLLPEPERRSNGYRVYDTHAVLRLVRIRRLRQLGLSLPEVHDALSGSDEGELRTMLAELVADLERQETALREQRQRLLALLDREQDVALPTALAEILAEIRRLVPHADLVAREGELLELLEATMDPEQFGQLAEWYRQVLADPEHVARGVVLGQRFEALAALDPQHPEVGAVAAEIVALGRENLPCKTAEVTPGPAQPDPVWAAYQATLAPAQRRCLELAEQGYAR